ncbi:hypothetical protein EZV62_011036 [Acer yangbiense]|uniref:Uncharacterized protein n=1 Tax=Acer yangbiense TaxID=1000413 RepID=A0A5C7I679_9ROSI|nr:hypothetical protein EZV62_011036 [Acer yangbiense]
MAANKPSSSSPIPSSRPNPNSRNSEIKDPMRRSFTGNPFSKPSSIVANSRGGGGFNPNTPANSPSDFPRRSSIGRESLSSLRDFEDKENSKDSNLKSARVRSPASASKGTKNFMSPTISAASKFATSPRKKILAERNESVRSSVSFSEAKVQAMEDNDSKPEISLGKKKTVTFSDVRDLIMEENDFSKPEMGLNQIESSHDSTITDLGREETVKSHSIFDSEVLFDSKSDVSSSLEAASKEKDCINLDSTFKISPRTSCPPSSPMLAPLDADPLMPPYDPKTNYLSPRPQFLHYRPNPRIESMLNKVKDGKRLEESFASENSSDSEDSEILSEDSQKESEDLSSDETVKETNEEEETAEEGDDEAVEEEEELNVSEPNPFSTHRPKEESVQAKVESKSKFFTRSKFIAFVLVLMFACLSISVSDSQLAADLSLSTNFYVPPEVTEFAKVTFEELVRKSRLWSANSIAYICKLISSFRGMHTLGHLQYGNLTVLLETDHLVDGHLKFVQKDASADFNYEKDFLASIRERNLKSEPLQHEEIEDDENIEETEDDENIEEEENSPEFEEQVLVHQEIEVHDNINEASEDHTDSQSEEVCSTPMAPVIKPDLEAQQTQEIVESNVETDIKLQSNNIDLAQQHVVISEGTENQPAVKISEVIAVLEVAEIQPEVSFAEEPQGETDLNSELDASSANLQNSATFNGSENNYLTKNVVGISLSVLLSLLAATAFFTYANAKKGKPSTSHVDQPALTKKFSPISVSAEHTFQERLSSRNWQTEVEMVGESCPSEMSSFKGSSYRKEVSEAQSQERKQQPRNNYWRESLASSEFSMGSPSYGSFTTYEKISSKVLKGCGEDEVVTPVRRSSRIRKQVGNWFLGKLCRIHQMDIVEIDQDAAAMVIDHTSYAVSNTDGVMILLV